MLKTTTTPTPEEIIRQIEDYFRVPQRVADKIQNKAEKVKGGYVLVETRAPWDGSNRPWTQCPVAKFILYKPSGTWKLYWRRGSEKWVLYQQYTSLSACLQAVREDARGCFWG